jgi:hypothetical protein
MQSESALAKKIALRPNDRQKILTIRQRSMWTRASKSRLAPSRDLRKVFLSIIACKLASESVAQDTGSLILELSRDAGRMVPRSVADCRGCRISEEFSAAACRWPHRFGMDRIKRFRQKPGLRGISRRYFATIQISHGRMTSAQVRQPRPRRRCVNGGRGRALILTTPSNRLCSDLLPFQPERFRARFPGSKAAI